MSGERRLFTEGYREMKLKAVSGMMLTLLLIGMLTLAFNIQPVKASGTIYIRADGSVEPDTAPISTVDNVTYNFIGNINESIVVERDNIVVDGAGYTVQGTGSGDGIHLSGRSNVTIKNMKIKAFRYGIYIFWSSNYNTISGNNITENNEYGICLSWPSNYNSISGNNITNNHIGIYLHGSDNTVSGNNITNNDLFGIKLGAIYGAPPSLNNSIYGNNITNNGRGIGLLWSSDYNTVYGNHIINNEYGIWLIDSSNNIVYHNNFVNNSEQVYCYVPTNVWDEGYPSGGNYWSDYNGTDFYSGPYQNLTGSDGLGDTPYVIDPDNQDNYPLMNPWAWYTLTIYSSPTGVIFSVDGVSHTTPWSGTYSEGTSVSLVMPEIHTVGDARHYWDQWSDGVASRSRTVTMDTEITLSGDFAGPYYELTVASSPMTGIAFTIDGISKTTPYTEWLPEGSYTLVMPQTHNGYVWSHWLEDGDTNRIKTILLQGTTWTAVFEPAPKPVGGKATPISISIDKSELQTPWIWLTTIILPLVATVVFMKLKKKKQ